MRPTETVPPDDLGTLLEEKNFTKREILEFYQYGKTTEGGVSKQDFAQICFEKGIRNANLVSRIWDLWDINHDGTLSVFELIKGLNPLLRGDRATLAGFLYDLYDKDGNCDLTSPEIISVYSDLVHYNNANQEGENENSSSRGGLSQKQKQRIRDWVQKHQNEHGKLDKESFVRGVDEAAGAEERQPLWTLRTLYYVFLTAWFEMGTSFSLPAMGALSNRIQDRFDIGEQEIGTLTSAYFFAAMVGPLAGGFVMDKIGPGWVVIGANVIVVLGAALQASANGNDQFWLIVIGRLLLGFGGEITPFTTIEILGRLFPDYFGLMAGVRNLIQSISGFLAFVLLPIWADAYSDGNSGTTFALWMCVVLGLVSLLSTIIVYVSMTKENRALSSRASAEACSDQASVSRAIRAFGKATAPKVPSCRRWCLPLAFYLACFGIKAQYFAPFGFTAFSNNIYKSKFDQTSRSASFLSGFISLVAGLMSPAIGEISDRTGQRSLGLAFGSSLSAIGFLILAASTGGTPVVWIASTLFALQYGIGDTVAYISIRFIVGVTRSGIGYGIYGVVGNLIATVVPIVGGVLMDKGADDDDGNSNENAVLWYFTGLMALGTLTWITVWLLEGPRSLIELPANKVVETTDENLKAAALCFVVSPMMSERDNSVNVSTSEVKLGSSDESATEQQEEQALANKE